MVYEKGVKILLYLFFRCLMQVFMSIYRALECHGKIRAQSQAGSFVRYKFLDDTFEPIVCRLDAKALCLVDY